MAVLGFRLVEHAAGPAAVLFSQECLAVQYRLSTQSEMAPQTSVTPALKSGRCGCSDGPLASWRLLDGILRSTRHMRNAAESLRCLGLALRGGVLLG